MPRRLSRDVNALRLFDHLSGSELILYYRMPATSERLGYLQDAIRRDGTAPSDCLSARIKWGLTILTGVRRGDFEVRRGEEWVVVDSEETSPDFAPDWREQLAEHAPEIVELLAARVFEAPLECREPHAGAGGDPSKNS